jgi:putative FmdB family regulatory protein
VPIYEYRCPNGHTFERFQSMTAPAPEKCDVCGAAPLELVLYPIAIHYKGSGFYSTDYGKGRSGKKDGDSSGDSSGESSSKSDSSKGDSSKGDSSKGESSKSDSSSSGDSKSSDAKPKPAT